MHLKRPSKLFGALLIVAGLIVSAGAGSLLAAPPNCGGGSNEPTPFTDLGTVYSGFCPGIFEAYFSGLLNGNTPSTFNPTQVVDRQRMAPFISKTLDQSLQRGSKRALLGQWWTPQNLNLIGLLTLNSTPATFGSQIAFDGTDLWVASRGANAVYRVQPGNGQVNSPWTGMTKPLGVLVAGNYVYITGSTSPHGVLYAINRFSTSTTVFTVNSNLGANPSGIATDGANIWTANFGTGSGGGSVSIYSPAFQVVNTVLTGFTSPVGILYDGANIWVTDAAANQLFKLDSFGSILLQVPVGPHPNFPVFDGTNIWVPSEGDNSVTVVRAVAQPGSNVPSGTILATLTQNNLNHPIQAAFDGQRVLVSNYNDGSVSIWKAVDLTPIATSFTYPSSHPFGVCSDGINFWMNSHDSTNEFLVQY